LPGCIFKLLPGILLLLPAVAYQLKFPLIKTYLDSVANTSSLLVALLETF
jgi:hypothetical protein